MSELGTRLSELPKPTDEDFLLVCNTQNRSSNVVQQFQAAGYKNLNMFKAAGASGRSAAGKLLSLNALLVELGRF